MRPRLGFLGTGWIGRHRMAALAASGLAEIVAVAQNVLGRRVPCLYGGSVNPGNCQELVSCPHIDGL